jgi:hypothetical protein
MDRDAEGQQSVDLHSLSAEERQHLYKQYYGKNVEPLTHILAPDECSAYPELADEIFTAYLRYTTFAVKVWINYDALQKRFFNHDDQRFQDCGQLQLTRSQRQSLESLRGGAFEIRKVKFEIGTPFAHFCTIKVQSSTSTDPQRGPALKALVKSDGADEHPIVTSFVEDMAETLEGLYLADVGQTGFRFVDLVELATYFRRLQTADEAVEYDHRPGLSIWTDFLREREEWDFKKYSFVETERNEGFVDLDEVEWRKKKELEKQAREESKKGG